MLSAKEQKGAKLMEMTERKKKVLRSVVDLYIRTAEPVGSKAMVVLTLTYTTFGRSPP